MAEAASDPAKSQSPKASSLFGSLQSTWRQISDSQRIGRLQQCQALHDILSECRRQSNAVNSPRQHDAATRRDLRRIEREIQQHTSNESPPVSSAGGDAAASAAAKDTSPTIENTPAGIRMLHYFQWRNLEEQGDDGASVLGDARRLCTREEHALWSCRAVATACGPDLIQVKRCFDETGPSILKHAAAYDKVSAAPSTSEEAKLPVSGSPTVSASSSSSGRVPVSPPCVDVQRSMGSCVARGIDGLNQRIAEDKI